MKRISATEARNRLGEIIEEAYHSGETMIVERRSKQLVAIVPLSPVEGKVLDDGLNLPVLNLGKMTGKLSRDDIYDEDGR